MEADAAHPYGTKAPRVGFFCLYAPTSIEDGSTLAVNRVLTSEELNRIAGKVFEMLSDGVLVTDAGQTIVYVNPTFTRLTGYTHEDVVGKTPRLLSSGRHSKDFYKKMWKQIHKTGSWQGEIWNRKKNGDVYVEELTITRVTDENGRVTHYVGIFKDITARINRENKIRHLAMHDLLTGLPNRFLLRQRLEEAISHAERTGTMVGVLYMDLDRFKRVNDNLGHHAGDILLKHAAERIKECLEEGDTIARLGGDELVVLLPGLKRSEACADTARRILQLFEKPFRIEGHELNVTCSIGISVYPEHADKGEELVRLADHALYEVKNAGRNDFRFYAQ